jgi:hypothetical protein
LSDITTIDTGSTYGVFDVDGFAIPSLMNDTNYAGSSTGTVLQTGDDAIVMSSNEDITLSPNKMIDLYSGMYIRTEDTSGTCLKMTLWKTYTINASDTVADENSVVEDEGVIVVDLAEEYDGEKESDPESPVADEENSSSDSGNDGTTVESSMNVPGFELIFGVIGLFCAVLIRRN